MAQIPGTSGNQSYETGMNHHGMDYGELPNLEDSTTTDKSDSVGTSPNVTMPERLEYEVYESPRKTQNKRTKKAMTMLQCDECKATFRLPQDLLKHKKLHKGEQLFECHICGRTYTRRDNMKLHMRIHIKERPFSCAQCGETFRYRPNLTRHKHIKHGLPKAYSLTPTKTKEPGIDRAVLTGLLPDYNMYSQHNPIAVRSMASVLNSGQQHSERTVATSASVDLRYTGAGYHRQDGYVGVMTSQPTNYTPSMPVIGQVYSLNQPQQLPSTSITTLVTTSTSKINSETRTSEGKQQFKPQKINNSCSESLNLSYKKSVPQITMQETESSGSGGEGTNDGFTIHWKVLESEGVLKNPDQLSESGSNAGAKNSSEVFSKNYCHSEQNNETDAQMMLSTDSEESGQRSLNQDQDNPLDDQEDDSVTMVRESEEGQHEGDDSDAKIVSPPRLTIPRISLKIGNQNLASTFSRRKQMLPLRLSLGRSQLKAGGQKKDTEAKSVKSSEKESVSETESKCESCSKLKEFQCQYCQISFPDLSTFMIHRGCHGRESPFQCNACGQCCKDRVEFNAHIITGHFM